MKDKAVAVGREHKRDIERHGIVESLLHAVADAVVVVLGLDDGDGNIGLVIKDVIGALGFAAGNELSANDDAALGEIDLLADLHHPVPARAFHGGAYELGADIAFAEVFLVHAVICLFPLKRRQGFHDPVEFGRIPEYHDSHIPVVPFQCRHPVLDRRKPEASRRARS